MPKRSMPKSLQAFYTERKRAEKAKKKSFKYKNTTYVPIQVTMWKKKGSRK